MSFQMSSGYHGLWINAIKEKSADPFGAAGDLMRALGHVLGVELVEYGHVGNAALFLLDLSSLGLKGMDMNVGVITHPPADDEEAKDQARLITDYKTAVHSIGFCFHVILQNDTPSANPYMPSSTEVVYVSGEDLKRLFESRFPSAALFDVIRRQVQIHQLCPFNTTKEARGSMFRGRAQELQKLVDDLDVNYLLTGARLIGKTSLFMRAHSVLHVKKGMRDQAFYFDCSVWGDYWDCAHRLARKIDPKRDLRLHTGERNLAYLLQRRSAGGTRPLVLFFDECDRLVSNESQRGWPFFAALHEAATNNWIQLRFAGFRSVQELNQASGSPFFGSLREIILEPLSSHEAERLLADPFPTMGIQMVDRNYTLRAVYRASGGLPFLVQFYGEHLFAVATSRTPPEILPGDTQEIDESFELHHFLLSYFQWNTISEGRPLWQERLCALLYALEGVEQGWTERDFLDACRRYFKNMTFDEVVSALAHLYYACVLRYSKDRYSLTFPILREALKRAYPTVNSLLQDMKVS